MERLSPQTLEVWIAALVRQLVHAAGGPPAQGERGRVILDMDVGDARCVVIERPPAQDPGPGSALSPREQEIARMVALGYVNKTIANVLDISCWTVSTHLRRIFAKLGVTSRAAMVARLAERGGAEFGGMIPSFRVADRDRRAVTR